MQKFILKSKSKDELQDKIKNMIVLNNDEIVEITELKKPRNLFIFSKSGFSPCLSNIYFSKSFTAF